MFSCRRNRSATGIWVEPSCNTPMAHERASSDKYNTSQKQVIDHDKSTSVFLNPGAHRTLQRWKSEWILCHRQMGSGKCWFHMNAHNAPTVWSNKIVSKPPTVITSFTAKFRYEQLRTPSWKLLVDIRCAVHSSCTYTSDLKEILTHWWQNIYANEVLVYLFWLQYCNLHNILQVIICHYHRL